MSKNSPHRMVWHYKYDISIWGYQVISALFSSVTCCCTAYCLCLRCIWQNEMNATGKLSIIYILNQNWKRCPDRVFKLYCRVTISRQMASIQLPYWIPHEEWDVHRNRVKEDSSLARTIKPYLDALTIKIHFYHDLLSKDTKDILPGMLLEFLQDGQRYSVHTFVWASELYLKKSKAKVSKQITAETRRRHEVVRGYFLSFLSTRLGVKDIPLSAITPGKHRGLLSVPSGDWPLQQYGSETYPDPRRHIPAGKGRGGNDREPHRPFGFQDGRC